jgi:hypothetical protein
MTTQYRDTRRPLRAGRRNPYSAGALSVENGGHEWWEVGPHWECECGAGMDHWKSWGYAWGSCPLGVFHRLMDAQKATQ